MSGGVISVFRRQSPPTTRSSRRPAPYDGWPLCPALVVRATTGRNDRPASRTCAMRSVASATRTSVRREPHLDDRHSGGGSEANGTLRRTRYDFSSCRDHVPPGGSPDPPGGLLFGGWTGGFGHRGTTLARRSQPGIARLEVVRRKCALEVSDPPRSCVIRMPCRSRPGTLDRTTPRPFRGRIGADGMLRRRRG